MWMGWRYALAAAESDSDPVLAPACSGSASCSQAPGDWAGSHFSPGLRPGRVRGAGGCVLTPSLFPSTGVGVEDVEAGCWVLGALPVVPPGSPKLCPAHAQQDTSHAGQMTGDVLLA